MRGNEAATQSPVSNRPSRWVPAAVGAGIVISSALWAFWPLDRTPIDIPTIADTQRPFSELAAIPLDLDAFRAPLWVAPPAPPPPVAAVPPPPPLKLQLVAILSENGEYRAALYDPDADLLKVVGRGDSVAGRRIERVGQSDVVVLDGSLERTLALRIEEGRP